jgi:uncharacterized protein YndB with AHSA1/START domain
MSWIFLIVILLIAALLIYAALQSSAFSIVREADFKASPAEVFANLNDFHKWAAWSPWEKMDPNLQRSFSGSTAGVGAKYSWVGNKKVGEGNMEITHSEAAKRMQLDLNFIKPFQASNVTEFTLSPASGGTHVKWEMRGQKPYMMKVMSLFMDMDKMVGKDFEAGLANLRGVVEK